MIGTTGKRAASPPRYGALIMALLMMAPVPLAADQDSLKAAPTDAAQPCFKISIFSDFGEIAAGIGIKVLDRMYSLAGYCMEPVYMPSVRSMRQLMSGDLDGEMVRAPTSIVNMDGQAILVPQPMMNVNIQFTWVDGLPFNGTLQDLQGKSVGILRGLPLVQTQVARHTDKITLLQNLDSAGELLKRGRVDVLVGGALGHAALREKMAKQNVMLRAKVFWQVPAYHALHIRHADKINKLAAALKTMIENGEFKDLKQTGGLLPADITP